MTIGFVKAAALLLLIGMSAPVLSAQRGQTGAACDKACLDGIADAYLAALVAHDPSKAPLAPNAKFTEQAQPMAIGEGQLWKLTTEGPTTLKGLVFAYSMFRHPLDAPKKNYPVLLPDGTISDRSMNFEPFDLEASHIYKIYDGKMHEIEAMGFTLPLYSKNGWSPFIK